METVLITAGVVCLVAAITAGGLKLAGNEVPKLESTWRQVAIGLLGASLLALGLWVADRTAATAKAGVQPASARTTVAAESGPEPDAEPGPLAGLLADRGYIYLGMRGPSGWVANRFAPGPIVDAGGVPTPGQVVRIVRPVHLRQRLPMDDFPTRMASGDDLGVLKPGTVLEIGRVSVVGGRFHWASVRIATD